MTARETLKHIWAHIDMNRILSSSGHFFVTQASLKTILTESAISKAVAELDCEPDDRLGLASIILNRGLITFAILVWMHQEDAITAFRCHGALDSRLPLREAEAQRIVPQFGNAFSRDYQWQFLPHKLERNEYREIEPSRILPFILEVDAPLIGGFGTVTKQIIHPDLQDFRPNVVNIANSASIMGHLLTPRRKSRFLSCENLFASSALVSDMTGSSRTKGPA